MSKRLPASFGSAVKPGRARFRRVRSLWCLGILGSLWLGGTAQAGILPYGFNKVPYRQFEWKMIQTAHFEVYFYPEEEQLARRAAWLAEQAYDRNTKRLEVYPFERTPLFIYRNQPEFQQTNIIPGYIGEGTGGVTEAVKNRIVVPADGSHRRIQEVIQHEFIHRLQFEVLYGGFAKSLKLLRSVFVPLWMAEGMAEYFAEDEDPSFTAMLLRDAAVTGRLRSLEQLDNFNHLDGREIVLAYKMGQSAFDFLAREFGEDRIGALLKEYQKPQMTVTQALRYTIGMEIDEFSEKWQAGLRERSWKEVIGRQPAAAYGRLLTPIQRGVLSFFSKPVWVSPPVPPQEADARVPPQQIMYFSDHENYQDIYVLDLRTFQSSKLLGLQYEGVQTQGQGLSVSADGTTMVFAAVKAGTSQLFFYDLAEKNLKRSYQGPFELVSSPAFSPDGSRLAFVGRRDGMSDIYVMRPDGSDLRPLTQDRYDDDAPHWSPDGRSIVHVTERGTRQLALIEGVDGSAPSQKLLTRSPCEHLTPWWDASGERIYYASDEQDARYNLYVYMVKDGEIRQLTQTRIGVFTPRPSPDGKTMLMTAFEGGSQQIYLISEDKLQEMVDHPVARWIEEPPALEPSPFQNPDEVKFREEDAAALPVKPYVFSPSIDLVYFLFGYDSVSGFVGGGYLSGSDLLGEHQFELVFNAFRELTNGYQFTYLYMPLRVQMGVRFYGWRNEIPLRDPLGQDLGRTGSQLSGVALLMSYPFDRYSRLEMLLSTEYQEEVLLNVATSHRANLATMSFVQERRVFHSDEPISGMSNNLTVQRADRFLGGSDRYLNVFDECQWYVGFTRELVWASRLFFGMSAEENRQSFVFGGINTLRGYGFQEFSGNGLALFNTELRFPLQPHLNLTLWPLNWLLLKRLSGGVFIDAGAGWTEIGRVNVGTVKSSVGGGLRLHSFLLQSMPMILRMDVAKRLDTSQPEVYYLGIGHAF